MKFLNPTTLGTQLLVLVLVVAFSFLSEADVSESYALKIKRNQIEIKNKDILKGRDPSNLSANELILYSHNLSLITKIDEKIFESNQETIERVRQNSAIRNTNYGLLTLTALFFCVLAFLGFHAAYTMNKMLKRETDNTSSYIKTISSIFTGLVLHFLPPNNIGQHKTATNLLILVSMIFILVSFVAYLVRLV